eukprot:COSAG01_NODE_6567_length_3605_cov_4.754136_3_plen_200_part_00
MTQLLLVNRWVANTVGYYNRKFFVLFLFYTMLTTGYAAISIVMLHDDFDASAEKGGYSTTNLPVFATMLDSVLCVTMVGFGGCAWTNPFPLTTQAWKLRAPRMTRRLTPRCVPTDHVKMCCTNETSIEPGDSCSGRSRYNVGVRANLESVFGTNPRLWLLPIYGEGPSGDGIHWPCVPMRTAQHEGGGGAFVAAGAGVV